MKVCVFVLCILSTALSYHVPEDVGPADSVPLVIPGSPVSIREGGDILLHHLRIRRGTGYGYTTPDGTTRTEQFEVYVDPRVKDPLNKITGHVSYRSPEGVPISYNYIADGAGYRILPSSRK